MATEEELIAIRVAVRAAQQANRELAKVARAIDDIGDEAEQADRKADKAARSITRLGAASGNTRVNLGPFSTSMRGATLVIGGMVLAAEKLTPAVLSAGEAVATLAGGAGAAGGVGLLALGQASVVASLGIGDLTEALGGNEEAARSLSPQAYELYRQLSDAQDALKGTAQAAMLPGLTRGGMAMMRNFRVINRLVDETGRELGRLAGDGGSMLGSAAWGRDVATLGRANVQIIGDLGDAGLHLADAARHILVEAAPLAEWLAENAEKGSAAAEAWAEGARKGGDLRRFFQDAKTDITLFGESVDHVVDGLGNLFDNQDVDGTKFLADIEKITGRFEEWTDSPAVRENFGGAIRDGISEGIAAGVSTAAENLPGAAARAAEVFWDSFANANTEGKALIALLTGAKISGAIRGMTPVTPLYVQDVTGIPGGGPGGGLGKGGSLGKVAMVASRVSLAAGAIVGFDQLMRAVTGEDVDAADVLRPESQGGQGGAFAGKTPAGFPTTPAGQQQRARVRGVGEGNTNPLNPPGPFDPIIENHVVLKLNGDVLTEHIGRGTAKRNARKR